VRTHLPLGSGIGGLLLVLGTTIDRQLDREEIEIGVVEVGTMIGRAEGLGGMKGMDGGTIEGMTEETREEMVRDGEVGVGHLDGIGMIEIEDDENGEVV
jgi:hypothetical protein